MYKTTCGGNQNRKNCKSWWIIIEFYTWSGQFYITCPVGIGLGCISKWLGWIPTVAPLRASTSPPPPLAYVQHIKLSVKLPNRWSNSIINFFCQSIDSINQINQINPINQINQLIINKGQYGHLFSIGLLKVENGYMGIWYIRFP